MMSAAFTSDAARADKALWAKCPTCAHCWPAAYYPIDLGVLARVVGGVVCPKGCTERSILAKQDDGVLQEVATP